MIDSVRPAAAGRLRKEALEDIDRFLGQIRDLDDDQVVDAAGALCDIITLHRMRLRGEKRPESKQ